MVGLSARPVLYLKGSAFCAQHHQIFSNQYQISTRSCRYKHAELIHCRYAMAAVAGILIPDVSSKTPPTLPHLARSSRAAYIFHSFQYLTLQSSTSDSVQWTMSDEPKAQCRC